MNCYVCSTGSDICDSCRKTYDIPIEFQPLKWFKGKDVDIKINEKSVNYDNFKNINDIEEIYCPEDMKDEKGEW